VNAIENFGFGVEVHPDSDAYLKAHGALILPLAYASFIVNHDGPTLASNNALIHKSVQGIKEGLKLVKHAGYDIYPKKLRTMKFIPYFLLKKKLITLFESDIAKIVMTGHASVAEEEMRGLSREFELLKKKSRVKTPNWDDLRKRAGLN